MAGAARWISGCDIRERRLLAVDRVVDVAGECVGEVGLSDIDPQRGAALIGWWVAAEHRGRGHATAAVEAMVALAFEELGLRAVVAQIGADNDASVRVAEAVGFERLRSGSGDQPHVYVARRTGNPQPPARR